MRCLAKPRKNIEIGKEYGRLTVLGPAEKDKTGHIRWKVRCRCGHEYVVLTGYLSYPDCKCINCKNRVTRKGKTYIGEIINGFEVISKAGKNKYGGELFNCRCLKCGNEFMRTRGEMTNRKGKYCQYCVPEYHFQISGDAAIGTLPDGTCFKIDADAVEEVKLWHWHIDKKGYIIRGDRGLPKMMLHWYVLGMDADHNNLIDHINRDKTDCRRSNLRQVTPKQNSYNHSRHSTNRSGYTGAFWDKRRRKWKSDIYTSGRHVCLGYFDNKVMAAQCYNYAAVIIRGKYVGELNDVPAIPDKLKKMIYEKCSPFMDEDSISAEEADFLLQEVV